MKAPRLQQKTVHAVSATGGPVPLLDLPAGLPARLCEPGSGDEPSAWLVSLGFVPGTRLRIIRSAPLGGAVEIDLRGTRVCVRRADLSGFSAIPEDEP